MSPAERFKAWLESLSRAWGALLKGWLSSAIAFGFEVFADVMAKSYSRKLAPFISALEQQGNIPPEMQALLNEIKAPTGEAAMFLADKFASASVGGISDMLLGPFLRPYGYKLNYYASGQEIPDASVHLQPAQLIQLFLRRNHPETKSKVTETGLRRRMREWGFSEVWIDNWLDLYRVIFPSEVIAPVWIRDKTKWEKYWDDVRALGVSDDRIELLKESVYRVPGVQDIIRYVVKEAYSPDIYKKFGQDQEYPSIAEADAEKTGVRPDHLMKEWIAHWELPGISQGFEMLHRGVIDADTLKLLLKARDVMPYWRDKLEAISYIPYNRIDARRMWDMRVLNDAELKRAYLDQGYDSDHADKMVLWTKLYVSYPQLVARYKNGWINSDTVLAELINMGLPRDRATELFQTKFKNEAADRTAKERDLTAADIIAGVRRNVITRAQGLDLLKDMGYDASEAQFKLAVGAPLDELDTQKAARELTKADILAGLKAKTITQAEARTKLAALRYKPADVDYLIRVYVATIKPLPLPDVKALTKADILGALKAKTITLEQARSKLIELNYSPVDADFVLRVYQASITPPPEPEKKEASRDDITTAVKGGLITPEQGYTMLFALGFSATAAEFILAVRAVPPPPPPTPEEREASKADVVLGVKKGLITPEQGYTMLIALGYSAEAANFILLVHVEESPFSPISYEEFKGVTQLYQQSQGMETEPITTGELQMRATLAQAELEGKGTQTEQLRLNIDTVRRQRRKRLITREQELQKLLDLDVPADYVQAMVANDDTRLTPAAK